MRRIGLALGLCVLLGATGATAAEEPVIGDVLEILKDRGIIDEGEYGELVSKNNLYEEEHEDLLGRIELSGDFRFRFESFFFDDDPLGLRPDRNRLRYRLRINGDAVVNDWASLHFRLASGEGISRSTNRTLGRAADFRPNPIYLDRAYLTLKTPMPDQGFLASSKLEFMFGKTKNPFVWKNSRDLINWDVDINPEGVSAVFRAAPNEETSLFANAGYWMIQEKALETDPKVFAIQGGIEHRPTQNVRLGARGSWYSFHSLDPSFFARAAMFGSVLDGLGSNRVQPFEFGAYLGYEGLERWPLLAYGHYNFNPSAQASELTSAGRENHAWALGVEAGDQTEIAKVGLGYWYVEANSWPGQYTDSDVLDGRTNRKGWLFYGKKEVGPRTVLSAELFVSQAIREILPAFIDSLSGSDRVRFRADVNVKF